MPGRKRRIVDLAVSALPGTFPRDDIWYTILLTGG